VRGILGGALTLIVLQVFTSSNGPEAGGKLIGWLNTGIKKALSPDVALIPTARKAPPAKTNTAPSTGGVSLPRNPSLGTVQT
jgi:hypothetical protein